MQVQITKFIPNQIVTIQKKNIKEQRGIINFPIYYKSLPEKKKEKNSKIREYFGAENVTRVNLTYVYKIN